MKPASLILAAVLLISPPLAARAAAEAITEPRSGVAFEKKHADLSLVGVGLRTKTILKVKVYAIGLFVADSALAGLRAKAGSPGLYKDLVWGDFRKELQLELVRDVTAEQIQGAFRETLAANGADKARTDAFVAYFGETKTGQDYVLRWAQDGVLETTVNGQVKPPIADKNFTAAVFSIWLGDKPIQDDIKKDLVSLLK